MKQSLFSRAVGSYMRLVLAIVACPLGVGVLSAASTASSTNQPPEVSIIFPPSDVIVDGSHVFIRARASDPDGKVVAVQFYGNGQLIGTVTNEPFNFKLTYSGDAIGLMILTAVAVDNLGATNISSPVKLIAYQTPVYNTAFQMTSPIDPTLNVNATIVLPAVPDLLFSARLVVSTGRGEGARFFIDNKFVTVVVDPPYQITIPNLSDGPHRLVVDTDNGSTLPNYSKYADGRNILIVPLLIQQTQLSANSEFSFHPAGRVAGKVTVIEASTNLITWEPISTNLTSTNSFLFSDPQATNYQRRFYRASFKE